MDVVYICYLSGAHVRICERASNSCCKVSGLTALFKCTIECDICDNNNNNKRSLILYVKIDMCMNTCKLIDQPVVICHVSSCVFFLFFKELALFLEQPQLFVRKISYFVIFFKIF